jgi:hypothetical protein
MLFGIVERLIGHSVVIVLYRGIGVQSRPLGALAFVVHECVLAGGNKSRLNKSISKSSVVVVAPIADSSWFENSGGFICTTFRIRHCFENCIKVPTETSKKKYFNSDCRLSSKSSMQPSNA